MAIKDDIENRLAKAARRVVYVGPDGQQFETPTDIPGLIAELAAILAEQELKIEGIRQAVHMLSDIVRQGDNP